MSISQRIHILKQFSLFNSLPEKELLALAEKAKEKIFQPHSIILSQYEAAKEVVFIYKGLVKIYIINDDGKIIPIRTKGPLYVVGELNLIDNETTATIETIQETEAFSFTHTEMKELLLKYPLFDFHLLKIVAEKLRAANRQTEYYFSSSLKHRTLSMLKALAPHFPHREVTLSQEELAESIGATRAKVGEVLQELQNEKEIILAYKKIQVQ